MLRVWSGTKQVINYKVEDIKTSLMIEKLYPRYSDFKRRVLIPALDALNETGYFEIDFVEKKEGKKVTSIDFLVTDLDTRKYFDKDIVENIKFREIEEDRTTINQSSEENEHKDNIEAKEEIVIKEIIDSIEPENDDIMEIKEKLQNPSKEKSKKKTKEKLVENEVKETPLSESIKNKGIESKVSFYVPDSDVFTKGTLRLFKKDFKEVDFNIRENMQAFDKAVAITMEKDDIDVISTGSYDFFKVTCFNIISNYIITKEKEVRHKREMEEMEKYFNEEIPIKKNNNIDITRKPVTDENIKRNLFDAGLVNEDGFYYK